MGTSITEDPAGFVTVLLGLSDVKILQIEQGSGGLRITIETVNDLEGCHGCGVVATGHGRDARTLRDVPIGGRPVELVWRKRVWLCKESNCPVITWSEQHEQMPPDELLTTRAGLWVLHQVGQEKRSVASVSRELAVSWGTVMNAVRKHGEPLIKQQQDSSKSPTAIGVDEHVWQHQNATRPTGYVTGIMDTSTSPAKLLDRSSVAIVRDSLVNRVFSGFSSVYLPTLSGILVLRSSNARRWIGVGSDSRSKSFWSVSWIRFRVRVPR